MCRSAAKLLFVDVEAHHLPARVHASIRAAGAHRRHLASEQERERLLKLPLHRQLPWLTGETAKRRAVVGNRQRKSRIVLQSLVFHARYCSRAQRRTTPQHENHSPQDKGRDMQASKSPRLSGSSASGHRQASQRVNPHLTR